MENQGKLKKTMRPIDVWGLALGAIIGWGCFVLPGNAFLPKAGPLGATVGLFLGAILILVIALSYGYMIRRFPKSGGEYVYTKNMFGKGHAFIGGWSMLLVYWSLIPLNATAIGLISKYLFPVLQFGELYEVAGWTVYTGEILVALAFIVLMAFVNVRGIKNAAWMQTAIALTLVGAIFLIAAMILVQGPEWSNLNFVEGSTRAIPWSGDWWVGVFAVVAMAPWAYVGFDCIPQAAEECNFDHKRSLVIMILAIFGAALCYIIVNAFTALVMPWEELLSQGISWPTGYAVEHQIGMIGLIILGIAMFCAVIAGMNAFYISTSRLMYAMAQDGALPAVFSKVSVKYGTPRNAILFVMVASLFAPWLGREVLGWIVDMTSVGASIVFLSTTLSATKQARLENNKLQMFIGILGTIISIGFIALLVIPGAPGFLATPSWIALGVWTLIGVVFFLSIRKSYLGK
ncbi:MAG: APC family permease [bacterium]